MAYGGKPDTIVEEPSSYSSVHFNGYIAFIVNIKGKPEDKFEERKGAGEEITNLQTVFVDKLRFKWINSDQDKHESLTLVQWDHSKAYKNTAYKNRTDCKCLRCLITSQNHSNSKCFILAISSHGQELSETEVIFADGESLKLTEIFEALSDANIPTLQGKPRIIILQVCRVNTENPVKKLKMQDRGVPIENDIPKSSGCDDSSESARDDTSSEEEDANVSYQRVALSKMPDNFMLIYPVVSGQQSQRNKIEGSWFISGLKEVLLEKYYREGKAPTPLNFLHYMTEVCNNVARKETVVYQRYVDQKGRTYVDQKGRTRKKKDNYGNKKIDKIWSGLKNTVCIYHRLTNEIIIYPLDQSKPPELLPPNY